MTGVDDAVDDGNVVYKIQTAAAVSADILIAARFRRMSRSRTSTTIPQASRSADVWLTTTEAGAPRRSR